MRESRISKSAARCLDLYTYHGVVKVPAPFMGPGLCVGVAHYLSQMVKDHNRTNPSGGNKIAPLVPGARDVTTARKASC
jgi:hypothetical protein